MEICSLPLTGVNKSLAEEFCLYPDDYFGKRRNEIAPYCYFKDGIQFHYPPHTPYEEAYRYWDCDEQGRLFRPRSFENANFEHLHAGFLFYFRHIFESLRNGKETEAGKYLGCLLHTLQDSTFGLHALEGAGGADAFLLDRMVDESDFPVAPSILAADITAEGCISPQYVPVLLGRTPEEATMRLYAKYVSRVADSRKAMFQYIMTKSAIQVQRMFDNASKLCADVIATCRGEGELPHLPLTEMEPHLFPFGGYYPYRYSSFVRDAALDRQGRRIPLKLRFPDGEREFLHGLSFGSHAEGRLLFWIAPDSYEQCRLWVGFHPEQHFGTADIQILNDGKPVVETTVNDMAFGMEIVPCNLFGVQFQSSPTAGVLCLTVEG